MAMNALSTMEEAEKAWLAIKDVKKGEDDDKPKRVDDMLVFEPSAMELAYHPKLNPCRLPELNPDSESYPARRTPEGEAKYNEARFDPHKFAECRFSPQKGLVVTVKSTMMPFVITEKKTVRLEPGLQSRGDVQAVKHVKLKPLGDFCVTNPQNEESIEKELVDGDWVLSTNCSPLELKFDYYFTQIEKSGPPELRAIFLDGLKRQKAFYPDLSLLELYHKLRPRDPELHKPVSVPPELISDAPAA